MEIWALEIPLALKWMPEHVKPGDYVSLTASSPELCNGFKRWSSVRLPVNKSRFQGNILKGFPVPTSWDFFSFRWHRFNRWSSDQFCGKNSQGASTALHFPLHVVVLRLMKIGWGHLLVMSSQVDVCRFGQETFSAMDFGCISLCEVAAECLDFPQADDAHI